MDSLCFFGSGKGESGGSPLFAGVLSILFEFEKKQKIFVFI